MFNNIYYYFYNEKFRIFLSDYIVGFILKLIINILKGTPLWYQ